MESSGCFVGFLRVPGVPSVSSTCVSVIQEVFLTEEGGGGQTLIKIRHSFSPGVQRYYVICHK